MGKSQRRKGGRGERYVVNTLRAAGFQATRNYADKVDGREVDVEAENLRIQVKNWGKGVPMSYYDSVDPGEGIAALVSNNTSDRNQPWLITLSLDDFIRICTDVAVIWSEQDG